MLRLSPMKVGLADPISVEDQGKANMRSDRASCGYQEALCIRLCQSTKLAPQCHIAQRLVGVERHRRNCKDDQDSC